MEVKFRPARIEDCFYFEINMRDADKIEAACISVKPAGDLLIDCVTHSVEAHVAYFEDGTVFALFGLCRSTAIGQAVPWMVATNDISKCKKFFFKTAKQLVAAWLDSYGRLWNIVHTDNKLAVFFLKRLGFTFGEKAWGRGGSIMIEFYKERGE